MKANKFFNNYIFFFLLALISNSYSQLFIQSNEMEGPTIISRQTFTVQSNDGTPVTITRINIRPGRNINSGNGKLTPFDLMRIMDSKVNDFFEAIISRQIAIFNALEQEEEKEREKEKEKKQENIINTEENNNQNNKNNNSINDKEFDLDEESNESKNVNNTNNNQDVKGKKENNKNKKMKKIGKLKVSEENLKNFNKIQNNKKKGKKLSKKEIIFSRICKYIFYSIIIFTFYILIKKLLEFLEIIDPEISEKNVNVNINNNKEEKKVENEVVVNKERENKQN